MTSGCTWGDVSGVAHAAYTKYYFLDPSFNDTDWDAAFKAAIASTAQAKDAATVNAIRDKLLATLGDPYTRVLTPSDAQMYTSERQGEVCSARPRLALPAMQARASSPLFSLRCSPPALLAQPGPGNDKNGVLHHHGRGHS